MAIQRIYLLSLDGGVTLELCPTRLGPDKLGKSIQCQLEQPARMAAPAAAVAAGGAGC